MQEHWELIKRHEQLYPTGDFTHWIIQAGRGFGKTRCAAENILNLIFECKFKQIGFINQYQREVYDIMFNGNSGILTALEYRYNLQQYFANNK